MKKYFIFINLLVLLIVSCEKSEDNNQNTSIPTITILYPENNSEITCEDCTIKIISILENKELIDLAHILVDDNIIASGLSDTLIAYHKPPSGINQTMNIEARIINFLEDDNVEVVDSYNNTININTVNTDPLISNPVFMNINNQFNMMRFPVTNREFIHFLNSNEYLEVELVEVIWGDENGNNYGDPALCHDRDAGDQYEPTECLVYDD